MMDTIGYLSRDNAEEYCDAVELWESKGYHVRCQAISIGGESGKIIGEWLDMDQLGVIEATFHNPTTRK